MFSESALHRGKRQIGDARERFDHLFGILPAIGMLHLQGDQPVKQALEELEAFERAGLTAAIVENYPPATIGSVKRTLEAIAKRGSSLVIGLNVLPNEYALAFRLAHDHGAGFIQLDHVAGRYHEGAISPNDYALERTTHAGILVLGGVWPKYYSPVGCSILELDIWDAQGRADAIVVTGEGTGKRTPIEKITTFRAAMGPTFPLVVGAGSTPGTVAQQLGIADGVIVGSYLKRDGNVHDPLDERRLAEYSSAVKRLRDERATTRTAMSRF
jgi:uncharacterized protein